MNRQLYRILQTVPGLVMLGLLSGSLALARPSESDPDEGAPFSQDPVVVTATRLEQPLSQLTHSVTVITQEDIQRQQAVTVADLLRRVPGVLVQSQGSLGEEVNVRIRGAEFDQVMVLLDGQKVNSSLTGEFDLGDLLAENIERIEVIRGGLSALYGSEAMGGVINILTRSAAREGHRLSLSSEGGGPASFRGRVEARGRIVSGGREAESGKSPADGRLLFPVESLGYSLSFSRTATEGQFQRRDEFASNTLAGLGEVRFSPASSLRWTTRYLDSRKELPIAFAVILRPGARPAKALVFDDNRRLERSTLFNALRYRQEAFPWWSWELNGGWVEARMKEDNPSGTRRDLLSLSDFLNIGTRRLTLGTQHNFSLGEKDTLTVGVEGERERVSLHEWGNLPSWGRGPFQLFRFNQDRRTWALYGQNQFFWGERWVLNGGLRWDESSQYGGHLTPRASLAYFLEATATRLIAGFSRGFRAPSFAELYAPGFGNRGLDPEKSRTVEVGVSQPLWERRLHLEATYFATRFSSLIDQDPVSGQFVNRGQGSVEGVEMRLRVQPWSSLTLAWNYTWMESRDRRLHRELPRRPRHGLNFNAHYAPGSLWAIDLDVETHSRQRNPFPGLLAVDGSTLGPWTSGYTRLRLAAAYHLPGARLFCRLDNLLDDDQIQETPGMPSPGLSFWIGLQGTWGE